MLPILLLLNISSVIFQNNTSKVIIYMDILLNRFAISKVLN